ncbi:MAG TPA: transposase [Pirellulales bacterium]|nr:transposase [Pirellulales bacterium]
MTEREQRGLAIATHCKVTNKNGAWSVPSQSGKGRYTVRVDGEQATCDCPDHQTRGVECKHIFAVKIVRQRELFEDGSEVVTESVTLTKTTVRKTYPQDWRAYNQAQTHEKEKFLDLLHQLCQGIDEPTETKNGRPRLSLRDALWCACFKIYSTFSGRRFMTDLRDAQGRGYISKVPHFNSIFNYLENPAVTPILRAMITESSLPLKAIEQDFAVDSSGFSTSRFIRWFDHKYGVPRQQHEWVKVHLMCGVRTNIVTAVEIRGKDAQDSPLLPPLARATAKNFKPREISGDKAYGSLKNYAVIEEVGATPYIAFKSIHTGAGGGLWAKMFHFFHMERDRFLSHYHKRSNAESTFSMIKAKFRDHVRSKSDVAMVNEVLAKIVCHNICVLIQETYELGISATFWREEEPQPEPVMVGALGADSDGLDWL